MTDINIGNWKTIEIFRAGTHTAMAGQEISFSDEDIDNMAVAYNGYRRAGFGAPLCLGHPASNSPAYGETTGLISKTAGFSRWSSPMKLCWGWCAQGITRKYQRHSINPARPATRQEPELGISVISVF
ncbi:hypothetical protein [Enterobacter hormaechei]|uniref:hypothetical protein n=1 Tax=Enterobacter hormaechei TaxID=158836 RepID=UPI0020179164|nr:hypothetical protein [Enterobacter hormaechei]